MKRTADISVMKEWLSTIDDDSYISSIQIDYPTFSDENGIVNYGAKPRSEVVIVNTSPDIPVLRFRLFQTSYISAGLNQELEVSIHRDSWIHFCLTSTEAPYGGIICEQIEAEILDKRIAKIPKPENGWYLE